MLLKKRLTIIAASGGGGVAEFVLCNVTMLLVGEGCSRVCNNY